MTEQLIATIGQIRSLRTTSLRSTLPFKETTVPRRKLRAARRRCGARRHACRRSPRARKLCGWMRNLIAAGAARRFGRALRSAARRNRQRCWGYRRRSRARWARRSPGSNRASVRSVRRVRPPRRPTFRGGCISPAMARSGAPRPRVVPARDRRRSGYAAAHASAAIVVRAARGTTVTRTDARPGAEEDPAGIRER